LIIAAVNFINISLAQAFKRFKEVGMRKVLGARKKQIFYQFIGESFVLTLFAALLSMIVVGLFLPAYNNLSGKNLLFSQLFAPDILLFIFILALFLSLAAGFYPSLFISKLPPSSIFSNYKHPKSSVSMIKKGLVIVQFVISVFLILATITVYQQLQYFKEVDLGFNKSGLFAVKIFGEFRNPEKQMGAALKDKLMNYPGISDVSFASYIPGDGLSIEHLIPEGRRQEELSMVRFLTVDEDYLNTMEIDLLEGRNFSHYTGNEYRFILNQAAAKALDLREPIGAKCRSYRGNGEVIGVMKDFNFDSLHNTIEPMVLEYRPGVVRSYATYYMLVKCKGKNVRDVITFTKNEFNKIAPDHLFNYSFVSDKLERLYYLETNLSDIFKSFSILSILISCLGLFGLSVYAAELRVKEIGIRKVLGATTARITTLLSKDFILWVIVANVIAWPLANYFMNEWLNNFAYRIEMSYWIFVVGGLLSLGIALFTVSYQSIKAARANPIASLKNE
jgi:putative ABC transport system permease protein